MIDSQLVRCRNCDRLITGYLCRPARQFDADMPMCLDCTTPIELRLPGGIRVRWWGANPPDA